jgi:hypothetical protein
MLVDRLLAHFKSVRASDTVNAPSLAAKVAGTIEGFGLGREFQADDFPPV